VVNKRSFHFNASWYPISGPVPSLAPCSVYPSLMVKVRTLFFYAALPTFLSSTPLDNQSPSRPARLFRDLVPLPDIPPIPISYQAPFLYSFSDSTRQTQLSEFPFPTSPGFSVSVSPCILRFRGSLFPSLPLLSGVYRSHLSVLPLSVSCFFSYLDFVRLMTSSNSPDGSCRPPPPLPLIRLIWVHWRKQ